jgi:hypothetical protein
LSALLSIQSDNDWSNDAVYVIDLESGIPQTLEFPSSRGNFVLHEPLALDLADPKRNQLSLSVETVDEQTDAASGAIGAQRTTTGDRSGAPIYRPERDVDSDGNMDLPVLLPNHPCVKAVSERDTSDSNAAYDRCLADGLVDAYEAATDTLRLQVRTPLLERHQYAVVITDRLTDSNGIAVGSPFPAASHPLQAAALARLTDRVRQPAAAAYYTNSGGDFAEHIRFAWTFTTSAPGRELSELYQRLSAHAQEQSSPSLSFERDHDLDRDCPTGLPRAALAALLRENFTLTPSQERALTDAYSAIARVITGTWSGTAWQTGSGTIGTKVPFWLTLPKPSLTATPQPVVIVSYEQMGSRLDGLRWAGQWARLGLATLGYERATGSLGVRPDQLNALSREFPAPCAKSLLLDMIGNAASTPQPPLNDLDTDVVGTRERWRTAAIDLAKLVESLQAADRTLALPALRPMAILGVGTGAAIGAMATRLRNGDVTLVMVDPAVSPEQAWRRGATWGGPQAQLWNLFGPRLSSIPVSDLESRATSCGPTDSSIRLVNADAPSPGLEVGCLPLMATNGARFPNGATVLATNLTSMSRRCVAMTSGGSFSLGLPSQAGDALELAVYDGMNAVVRFGRDDDCRLADPDVQPAFVLGADLFTHPDASLVTSAGGLGLERQSTELLQALDWAGAAFALANPSSSVATIAQSVAAVDINGLLLSVSPGNPEYPPDAGLALARAARLIPRFVPDNLKRFPELAADTTPPSLSAALPRRTAALSIEWSHLDEGVPRLRRFPPDASSCGTNVTSAPESAPLCHRSCTSKLDCFGGMECATNATCQMPLPAAQTCQQYLPDMDALAGDEAGFGAFRAVPFLRLTRYAGTLKANNADELWTPQSRHVGRLVAPIHPDWPLIALALPLSNPLGSHGIPADDLCQRFRFGNYLTYLFGRFMSSGGRDYPPVTDRDAQLCLEDPIKNSSCKFVSALE